MRLEHLTVGYDGNAVVRDVDLTIQRGEVLTIIGPNGAGKTTLLKTMARQLEPVAGTVTLDGEDLQKQKALDVARKMAVVFSDALRPERMTCREAVSAGRYPYTGRFGVLSEEDERIIEAAMEQVRVKDLADRPFDAVSDGQRQRVVLARALCQQPDIILLDEPTTFLDIRWKAEFLEALQTLVKEQGLTAVLTLHELDLSEKVSDRVACVKDGRLDRIGTPEDIFQNGYIARLFGMAEDTYKKWNL